MKNTIALPQFRERRNRIQKTARYWDIEAHTKIRITKYKYAETMIKEKKRFLKYFIVMYPITNTHSDGHRSLLVWTLIRDR